MSHEKGKVLEFRMVGNFREKRPAFLSRPYVY
jgi:hypothetical protein